MTKASLPKTINAAEAAHFGALAAEWWDPKGSSAMLHKLNPVRLRFIRSAVDTHFACAGTSRHPLAGKSALDVGCGAGLLCEPLARLGGAVTGVDAAPENIEAAIAHAALSGLSINYRAGEIAAQGLGQFDVVTCMEVIEHVMDPAAFVAELVRHLMPDGLLLLSTPNRTAASRVFLVEAAERLGQVPRGTHDWNKFLTPQELTALLADAGLEVVDMQGIAFSPMSGLHLSDNLALNYILSARVRGG
jgi:2-polyprenyl-6-hydroxyphenyl methylase/3-demethylubiquinone-9 3-methyltransferase